MAHGQAGAEIAFGHGPTLTCNHEAPIVAHALRAEGFDASEDGTGRGTPIVPVPIAIQERAVSDNPNAGPGGKGYSDEGCAYTLEARHHVQAVAFAQNQRDEVRVMEVAGALAAEPGMKQQTFIAFDCLAGGETALSVSDVPGALHGVARSAVAFDLRGREGGAMPEGPHETANIRAASGGSSRSYIAAPMVVRRITVRECERLQGFEDDFTRIPWGARKRIEARELLYIRLTNPGLSMDGARRLAADGPRYKALGNSWAVNCAEWIGERIALIEQHASDCAPE